MKNLTLYKVVNPAKGHEIFKDCIGKSPVLFLTISKDPTSNVCLTFRTGPVSDMMKFFDEPFVAADFNENEIEEVLDEDPFDFWYDDKFIYTRLKTDARLF